MSCWQMHAGRVQAGRAAGPAEKQEVAPNGEGEPGVCDGVRSSLLPELLYIAAIHHAAPVRLHSRPSSPEMPSTAFARSANRYPTPFEGA